MNLETRTVNSDIYSEGLRNGYQELVIGRYDLKEREREKGEGSGRGRFHEICHAAKRWRRGTAPAREDSAGPVWTWRIVGSCGIRYLRKH